ncbi:MAG: MMPL family transporter [Candidatus Thermoplasmatota archaeon]
MGLKEKLKQLDTYLDSKFDVVTKKEKGIEFLGDKIDKGRMKIGTTIKALDEFGDEYAERITTPRKDFLLNFITKRPKLTILIVLLITIPNAIFFQEILANMKGEMEIYLPPGEQCSLVLEEVRKDFSADIIIVYIEVKGWDITNRAVLVEMSSIEGDDDIANTSRPGLDYDREDHGKNDGIVYVLSISTIIKELNSSAARFAKAAHEQGFGFLPGANPEGRYSIPEQSKIDKYISQISDEDKERLLRDTNGDGKYDTAVIIFGVAKGVKPTDIVKKVEGYTKNKKYCKMTVTGPLTIIEKIQQRTVFEIIKTLPICIVFIMLVLYFFHRTGRIIIIALTPLLCALVITFGLVGALHKIFLITPQIFLAAPMLVALGVSYCLYISNRFAEEIVGTREEQMKVTVKAMYTAILLSAMTTAVGFASLMIGTLPPLATLGFTLTIGIILTCGITMIMSPALILALNYKKKHEVKAWRKAGLIPLEHRKKIVGIAISITIISLLLIPNVKFNADYLAMAPQDEPAVKKMQNYSKEMDAGQIGMVIVRCMSYNPEEPNVYSGTLMDVKTLDSMDGLEREIGKVESVKGLSIVDIMKTVTLPMNITIVGITIQANTTFWDAVHIIGAPNMQKSILEVFYGTLSKELREMLVNEQYSRALIFVDMPVMGIDETRNAVDGVNKVVDEYPAGRSTSYLTGAAAIMVAVNDLLILSQYQSLAVAIISCIALLAIVFRSYVLGIFSMLPCIVVVSYEPMTMFILDIPLSVITVMIGSIAIGTGVDYGIQLTQRMRLGGMDRETVRIAVEKTGISFVEATLTMVIGLSAILLVPVESIRDFVIMIMLLLSFNAIVALFLLSSIYVIWINWRERRYKS